MKGQEGWPKDSTILKKAAAVTSSIFTGHPAGAASWGTCQQQDGCDTSGSRKSYFTRNLHDDTERRERLVWEHYSLLSSSLKTIACNDRVAATWKLIWKWKGLLYLRPHDSWGNHRNLFLLMFSKETYWSKLFPSQRCVPSSAGMGHISGTPRGHL